jgi:predicted Zn-dependent peptidase
VLESELKANFKSKELTMWEVSRFLVSCVIALSLCLPCSAEETLLHVNLDVKEFYLENGMQFLVVERPATPQVACRVSIRAGSALEDSGKSGIAHMLEHMMFKGTKNFGTTEPERDRHLQNQIEAAYQTILKEEAKRNPDPALIAEKLAEMATLRQEVQEIYVPQAFSMHMSMNGAVGINAFTSRDETQYFMSVPSDMTELWFSMASEQLFEPAWREFYVEKEVVLREWDFRYVNNPDGAAYLDLLATAYTAHPYRNPTIGWKSDIERFNTSDAMAFHERYYNPANAVVVMVGDITEKKARELAGVYFNRYPKGRRAPELVTWEPPQQGPRKSIRFLKGARAPRILIGFHGAAMGSDDFYALDALTMILSSGLSARLNQEIVNKGLASEAWAYNPDNRFGGMVVLGGIPSDARELPGEGPEESLVHLKACEKLEKELLDQVEILKKELVSQAELERIKSLSHREFLDRMRSNQGLARMIATAEVQVGWRYLRTYLERIGRVTAEDVQRAADKYLREENRTTICVVPGGKLERPPDPYEEVRSFTGAAVRETHIPTDLANRSDYPTPEGWRHPLSFQRTPSKVTYAQAESATVEGAALFYLPDRELPLIDLCLLVKAGEVDVPESRQGLAQVFNDALVKGGTERFNPQELAFLLDEKAMKLSVSVNQEDTTVRLSVMKEDWEKGLEILEEILLRPRFDDEIYGVAKEQALTALKRQGESARAVAMREAMTWHFRGHPYGRDPLYALETLPAVTKEDLKAFLRKHLIPANMVVAISGDIERQEAIESVQRFFRPFPQKEPPARELTAPRRTDPVLSLIPKPGQVQAQVALVLPSVKRTHPDYWKISLLMGVFGGSDSLLYKRLRDDLGLVYAAFFTQTYKWEAGLLLGYIGCKGDMTSDAIRETVLIMEALGRDLSDRELERKRMDLLNSFVFNLDTPAQLVEAYARYHMRGEPLDTLDRIQDAYIHARKEELENLARTFLDPAGMQVFIVVDPETRVRGKNTEAVSIAESLSDLACDLDLPFRQIPLR